MKLFSTPLFFFIGAIGRIMVLIGVVGFLIVTLTSETANEFTTNRPPRPVRD